MARKTYTPVKQADGTFKIEGVEIFKLGESKGLDFNREWFDRAVQNHNTFRDEKDYLPSVKVGHDSFLDTEKPEIAVFDNLRLADDQQTVVCDYLIEDPAAFGTFNKFPHRSVEVFHGSAHFSRVAQLGGSEPYFKLQPLKIARPELFSSAEEPEIIVFDDGEQAIEFSGSDLPPFASAEMGGLRGASEETSTNDSELEFYKAERAAAIEKQAALELELATFRQQAHEQRIAQEQKFLEQRRAQFTTLGFAIPIIDSYFGLRTALLFADNPLDCTVQTVNPDGTPADRSFSAALDDFEQLLFKHASDNTLLANFGLNLPITEGEPQLHSEVATPAELANQQVAAIQQYFAEKGQTAWTNEEYRLARIELGFLKP